VRLNRLEEELLEAVWTAAEQGKDSPEAIACESDEPVLSALASLEEKGYVSRKESRVTLTAKGREAARTIVRCHRLGECLVWQVLRTNSLKMEQAACAFEHVLHPAIVDSICVLLGHPRTCPHGKLIPPGECCEEARVSVEQAMVPVTDLECGSTAVIACLRPSDPGRVERLLALGLLPGREITVQQTEPSVLLKVGESRIAIDTRSASEVFVWSGGGGGGPRRRRRRRGWRRWHFLRGSDRSACGT